MHASCSNRGAALLGELGLRKARPREGEVRRLRDSVGATDEDDLSVGHDPRLTIHRVQIDT